MARLLTDPRYIIVTIGWGARMKVFGALLIATAITLLSVSLAAQESLPASYLQKLATVDRLQKLTLSDLAELTSKAQSGGPEAQYQLALVYEQGGIVPRDKAMAQRWMLKSAEQEYVPAETGMGEMYLDNHISGPVPNYADADRWLRLAATQSDAEAQLWLGVGFERGYFGGTDYQESLKWLRKSAAQGLPVAQFCLAQMYEGGHGVPQSEQDAAAWFRRAADHFSDIDGVSQSEVQLAHMYRDGRLNGNDVEAYMWFAIVGALVDPPTDDAAKEVAKWMTTAQIAEAQQKVRAWIRHHPQRSR